MTADINQLPEDCISHVISFTSSRDACVSSAVSSTFRSAADSDPVWERFLPSDCSSILSRAVEPVRYPSKKALFFRLCDDPVLIDGGQLSFGLDRSSGAKCFMISARSLGIVWGDEERYWNWVPLSESRFPEGAKLKAVCWLEINGTIETKILSPDTVYTAHLIFKLSEGAHSLRAPPQEASISIGGQSVSQHTLCVQHDDDRGRRWLRWPSFGEETEEIRADVTLPKERGDGWMEIELGEFYNENGEDGTVEISFNEVRGGHWKKGLILQGIEIRAKS